MWQVLVRAARMLPAEAAHRAAVTSLRFNIGPRYSPPVMPVDLRVRLAGLEFANPLGLAAGFDKDAICFNGAMSLGFGHVEVGTITPLPQPGNPKPRVFRLRDNGAVINRYGFNSNGMAAVGRNLAAFAGKRQGILGVNVGANKTSQTPIDDYRKAVAKLACYADYVTLNISSPNTPGLRILQTHQHLADLLSAGKEGLAEAGSAAHRKPLFLKIAPDLHKDDLEVIVKTCLDAGVSGIIATNTTISRPPDLVGPNAGEAGGLSGAPLFTMATDVLASLARQTRGKLGLIGAGGISAGWQAYAKILVGADLVQLYTALALEGPSVPADVLSQVAALMVADGVKTLDEIRGQIPNPQKAVNYALRRLETLSELPEAG